MSILPTCTSCGKQYPPTGAPFLCSCGGIYDFSTFPKFSISSADESRKGIWKYKTMFGLEVSAPVASLGEGRTPLVQTSSTSGPVWLKLEYQNPTGSYKDRGSAVLASFLASRGVKSVVEDSSGNAGASLAAYAARSGIKARVFVPETASGPKRSQIEYYGAELISVPGPRVNAARAVREAVTDEVVYASHAYMPFGLLGIASIAYEIFADLGGKTPGTVIAPVGHGGLLYGVIMGFKALKMAAVVKDEPFYVGVQSAGCAPIFDAFESKETTLREPLESDTIAEGVRVSHPVRGTGILREIAGGNGRIMQVADPELVDSYHDLAQRGFFVEPTSALPWAVLQNLTGNIPEPVVVILTGAGFKSKL